MLGAILIILALGGAGLGVALMTKKITIAQIEVEVEKLAADAKAEEQAIVAKVKSLLAKI